MKRGFLHAVSIFSLFLAILLAGAFLFSQISRVSAQQAPNGFSFLNFNLDFGRVFPEEKISRGFTESSFTQETGLSLECPPGRTDLNYTGHLMVTLQMGGTGAYTMIGDDGGLCPSLDLKLTPDGSGGISQYQVDLDVPCIAGYLPQGEACKIVPAPGEYSCEYRIDDTGVCGSLLLDLDERIFQAITSNPGWQWYDQQNGEIRWDVCGLAAGSSQTFDVTIDVIGAGQWREQLATFTAGGATATASGCGGESYEEGTFASILGAATENFGDILGLAATGGGWEKLLASVGFLGLGLLTRKRSRAMAKISNI